MTDLPIISVIVIAFNRKEFLLRAINSVLDQTLEKSKYEVIVIKNFEYEDIDNVIARNGIISLLRGNEIVGSYICAAVEKSRGEILAFLDDDDEFVPDKLQKVLEIFSSDPKAGYYHNETIPIDSSGNEFKGNFRERSRNFMEKTGRFSIQKPVTGSSANKLFRAAAYGYLSSIAIRKAVILPYLSFLKDTIESAQDLFVFYCALLSPACETLVIDSLRLTRYRLHEANVSVFSRKSNGESSNENEIRILKFLKREEKTMQSILTMRATNDNHEGDRHLRIVRKMAGYELYSRKLNLDMVDPLSNRKRVFSDAIKYFNYSFRSRFFTSQVNMLMRSILWIFFPKTTKRVFVRRFTP
jgi:glycosyltransferase involved in cell wall biosynthesis